MDLRRLRQPDRRLPLLKSGIVRPARVRVGSSCVSRSGVGVERKNAARMLRSTKRTSCSANGEMPVVGEGVKRVSRDWVWMRVCCSTSPKGRAAGGVTSKREAPVRRVEASMVVRRLRRTAKIWLAARCVSWARRSRSRGYSSWRAKSLLGSVSSRARMRRASSSSVVRASSSVRSSWRVTALASSRMYSSLVIRHGRNALGWAASGCPSFRPVLHFGRPYLDRCSNAPSQGPLRVFPR